MKEKTESQDKERMTTTRRLTAGVRDVQPGLHPAITKHRAIVKDRLEKERQRAAAFFS